MNKIKKVISMKEINNIIEEIIYIKNETLISDNFEELFKISNKIDKELKKIYAKDKYIYKNYIMYNPIQQILLDRQNEKKELLDFWKEEILDLTK